MEMQKLFTVPILVMLGMIGIVSSDIHMVEQRHTDSYSIGGTTVEAVDEEVTYWVGEKGMKMESDSQFGSTG